MPCTGLRKPLFSWCIILQGYRYNKTSIFQFSHDAQKKNSNSSRRSQRNSTRASTLSSRPDVEPSQELVANDVNADGNGLLNTEMRKEITELVKTVVQDSLRDATKEISRQLLANSNSSDNGQSITQNQSALSVQEPAQDPTSACASFQVMGAQMPFQSASPDGFTPEIPATFIKSIQSGEFFDLSKLLPENLHGFSAQADTQSFHLALGENSTIKLTSDSTSKKKIRDIQNWTTAFTTYMKVVLDKFPGRAKELVAYLDLTILPSYAASYHQSLGWLLYDHKFRFKAANL